MFSNECPDCGGDASLPCDVCRPVVHIHHWVIESKGVQPKGVCDCGEVRRFTNEPLKNRTAAVQRGRGAVMADWNARMYDARALTWEPKR